MVPESPFSDSSQCGFALVITHRLQGMAELQRHQFVAEAVRRL